MENVLSPVILYFPILLSGRFEASMQHGSTMHDASGWNSTLNHLYGQKGYLEDILSKTATKLHALRDRQTRNERCLDNDPTPRSKKKKILQNKWRTNKTIQTCENEERAILECLSVCEENIYRLEALVNSTLYPINTDYQSVSDYNSSGSYGSSEPVGFDWNGWEYETHVSPFHRSREGSFMSDAVAPEALRNEFLLENNTGNLVPSSSQSCTATTVVPKVPPKAHPHITHANTVLSAQATAFESNDVHTSDGNNEIPLELDKLSISGLLRSKRMQLISKRGRPELAQIHENKSWAASRAAQENRGRDKEVRIIRKRTKSV
jgi:hypothetical protein